jgi:polysaccharide deacetylase family protein (PEP-CTERM system associated)
MTTPQSLDCSLPGMTVRELELQHAQSNDSSTICNAMTVDVEDYFHVAAFAPHIARSSWHGFALRVERNTARLLDLFAAQNVRGTFFVLGWVAERCPALVREIASRGHEIACHGYSHELIYRQSSAVFREETKRAKACLEDQTQRPVLGYRAASYSIVQHSLWAVDILVQLGFVYDSSIVPVRHDRYGIPGSPRWPYRLETPGSGGSILEFPPATTTVLGACVPVGGGGYFRIFPYWFTRLALSQINEHYHQPFAFYLHPWEIDPEQPRIRAGLISSFRHYFNLTRCEQRLRQLLATFRFAPARDVLQLAAAEPVLTRGRLTAA